MNPQIIQMLLQRMRAGRSGMQPPAQMQPQRPGLGGVVHSQPMPQGPPGGAVHANPIQHIQQPAQGMPQGPASSSPDIHRLLSMLMTSRNGNANSQMGMGGNMGGGMGNLAQAMGGMGR